MPTLTHASRKVLAAVVERRGGSVAELAEEAGIGRSTTNKILAALESQGLVTRTAGERGARRRPPACWHLDGTISTRKRALRLLREAPKPSPTQLPKGHLKAMVLGHLRDHPGEALTSSAVAKALGRSAGAVAYALVVLTAEGSVVLVGDPRPRRFTCAAEDPLIRGGGRR